MAKDPAFLFYSSDFITGVADLTMEERGQYITLLCIQHQKGRLSRKAMAIAAPNATADVISKFTEDENGLFYNERLEIEANKRKEHAEKQRQRALDGWKKRKNKDCATANATALPLEDEDENENERFNFKNSLLELGIDKTIVSDYLKVRSKKKAVNSETAFNRIKSQIEKSVISASDCIKIAAEKSWSGFEAEWISESDKKLIPKTKSKLSLWRCSFSGTYERDYECDTEAEAIKRYIDFGGTTPDKVTQIR